MKLFLHMRQRNVELAGFISREFTDVWKVSMLKIEDRQKLPSLNEIGIIEKLTAREKQQLVNSQAVSLLPLRCVIYIKS